MVHLRSFLGFSKLTNVNKVSFKDLKCTSLYARRNKVTMKTAFLISDYGVDLREMATITSMLLAPENKPFMISCLNKIYF